MLKKGWKPRDAARAIANYKAQLARDRERLAEDKIREGFRQSFYAAEQPYWGVSSEQTYYSNTPELRRLGRTPNRAAILQDASSGGASGVCPVQSAGLLE